LLGLPPDLDGSLVFTIGGRPIEIDILKAEWETVKPLYRTLIRIKRAQDQCAKTLALQEKMVPKVLSNITDIAKLKELSFQLATESAQMYFPISYRVIWDMYRTSMEK
jgi:hypothetical protein